MSVASRLAALRLPKVSPWAMKAVGELNRREDALIRADASISLAIRDDRAYQTLTKDELMSLVGASVAVAAVRGAVREVRDEVWARRFEDDPRE